MKIIALQCTYLTDISCFTTHKNGIILFKVQKKTKTENIDPKFSSNSNGRAIISKCAIYGRKKSRFIKHQEAKGLLSKLGIKTPLSKVPILGDILF